VDRTGEDTSEDVKTLERLGYSQELSRRMSGFSNFAVSLSIICILAGGITSFHLGLFSVGGAAIGIGWPVCCLFSLAVAATMAHVASAFPTAGGLYHWSAILGGRGWGWATAWFNLFGLVTVLSAINVGIYGFVVGALGPDLGFDPSKMSEGSQMAAQTAFVVVLTLSQALFNHLGIRFTTRLTDLSGYLILIVAAALTIALLVAAPSLDLGRLVRFENFSGLPEGHAIWPKRDGLLWPFLLGLILPAYTITGFDASAHTAEETISAATNVPRGILRSVLVSAIFGWTMLCALVLAIPDLGQAAKQGDAVFFWTMNSVLPDKLAFALNLAIAVAQYLCGLATVTSASRMAYAFARDGGLPFSGALKTVSERFKTPAIAIWTTSIFSIAFTLYTPVYSTITTVCVAFMYLSYVAPTAAGLVAFGRSWTRSGPWSLGRAFVPLAAVSVLGTILLLVIGVQPPNDKALYILLGSFALTAAVWFGAVRARFPGPPLELTRSKVQ
jgi:amino acid transporter